MNARVVQTLPQNLETLRDPRSLSPGAYAAEPKFDGWRILAVVEGDVARLWTRGGKEHTAHLPRLSAELGETFPDGTILDGELASTKDDWNTVQSTLGRNPDPSLEGRVGYIVFDLLKLGSTDVRSLPLSKRRGWLESVFAEAAFTRAGLIPHHVCADPAEILARHQRHLDHGFEGTVVKRLSAPYASGKRGHGWFRIKPAASLDVRVTGFTEGRGEFAGLPGAVCFVALDGSGTGQCSGMTMAVRRHMAAEPEHYLDAVAEIEHLGASASGTYRSPQWKRLRLDR